ncbi:MAG: DUF3795 domain-containing protein, partial [Tannerella sp.]|nr:DUF3795 domain-containing protein [Tannerella sp.]
QACHFASSEQRKQLFVVTIEVINHQYFKQWKRIIEIKVNKRPAMNNSLRTAVFTVKPVLHLRRVNVTVAGVIRRNVPVLYKQCKVRPCCIENGFFTCADCTIYASVKECKKYNPLLLKIASWVERSDRSKAIEMIQTKGRAEFSVFMEDKNWVCFKTKDSVFNKRFGKKLNEK